jgi:RND family efflux transporter MFP subunit
VKWGGALRAIAPTSPKTHNRERKQMSFAAMTFARFGWARRWFFIALALAALVMAQSATAEDAKLDTSQFTCLMEPKVVVKLGTPVPGLLGEVMVDRGSIVKKGDVVARLDSGVEVASVALAKARAANDSTVLSSRAKLEFQKRKSDRAVQLRRNENIAISTAEEAETAAKVAEGELREAQVNLQLAQLDLARADEVLKQRTIRSPIDGVVVERTLGPGEYVFDQAHLLTIAQIDPLNVEVFVPLSEFGKVRPGIPAEVYPEDPIGGKYVALVTVVDQVFDAASGTIGVRLELPNPEYALPAGLRCHVRFIGVS